MYKVFFKDNMITIASEMPVKSDGVDFQAIGRHQMQNVLPLVKHFLMNPKIDLFIKSEIPDKIWDVLVKGFTIIEAAGGTVFQGERLLVIKRLGKWDLPKGKIETGELPEHAAIREVQEETGISQLKIIKRLPDTWHIYKSPYQKNENNWILKKTYWYQMDYSGNEKLVPQTAEDIVEVIWVPINELKRIKKNTYASLLQIFAIYG